MSLQLYNLPLNPSTTIIKTLYGNFTNPKAQELILVKTKSIQLYSVSQNGKMQLIISQDLFCIIRTVIAFRYAGVQNTNKDLIVIGSDSGKVVILEYNQHQNRFVKTHEQTFGKTGCRRIVPGQYIACDPRGKAFMIAAVQKQKFVYVLQRHQNKLSILSPRQAHKAHTICCDIVALETGSDNAMFVCLQIDYGQVQDKQALINTGGIKKNIVYYEMDFGMNSVIRKKQCPVDPTAHMLIPVPGSPEGPGGVIVVLQDYLFYKNDKQQQLVRFPLRKQRLTNRKAQFTCFCTYRLKGFFFLISSQYGDIFKVDFFTKDNKNKKQVVSIKIEYFDTGSCLTSMALTKHGYLFCASQKQDHKLYYITSKQSQGTVYSHSQLGNDKIVEFQVTQDKQKRMLEQTDCIEQYAPMSDLKVADLQQDGNSQIYTLNSSGNNSFLRIIKQGLKVRQLNSIKYMQPLNIWCIKLLQEDQFHKMIVMTFANKTIVLTTTTQGYSQTKDTGIQENSNSLHIGRLDDDSLIQILPSGFRHIKKDKTARTMKFQGKVIRGMTKGKQMVLGLAGGDIIYYELDQTGSMSQAAQTSLESQVVAFDFSPIEKGRIRSNFLAVALTDNTARIFQLSPDSCLKILSTQNMKSQIQSIAIEQVDTTQDQTQRYGIQLYLYAGLGNGMIVRTSIDTITGKLTDSRPKYLGSQPVKCVKLKILGKSAILALSSRPWLIYTYGKKQMTTMLTFPYIAIASQIQMPNHRHTIMSYSQNTLKIISLQSFGSAFHSQKVKLDYSGKKLLIFKNILAITESDYQCRDLKSLKKQWKCQVTFYNPKQNKKVQKIVLEQGQNCVSMCFITAVQEGQQNDFIVLGCAKNVTYHPKFSLQQASIKVYSWNKQKSTCQFCHKTEVEDATLVLHGWKEKILAGVGNRLRLYEIGKKKLLRKAQIKNLNSPVNTIQTWGQRIFATQVNDSFHMYKYKPREQTFFDIADDVLNRYITATKIMDYHTIIGADKFQNIFISRVPQNAQQDFQNNPNSYKFRWENGYLNGAPFKMEQISSFYVGQIVTSIERGSLATSGSQLIVYSTINGSIAALCPFQTRQDVDFFTHLEMYVRNLTPSLGGRQHLGYRSYYSPCKAVIDGQLCEIFNKLSYQEQVEVGKHLDRTPQQIQKKLQQMRNRLL